MHAIQLHEFGPADNLRYEELPDIHAAPGQVRLAVEAAGVHVVDTVLRAGEYRGGPMPLPELPTIPGREVAGVVDEVGDGVDRSWLGRRVVVHLGMVPGGYASQAVAAVASLHDLPDSVSAAAAVAMIGTGRTTMAILADATPVPGDVVVVTAAAGGIGSLLVQFARRAGALVVGLAGGPEKVERVRQLGADLAVDYTTPDWEEQVRAGLDGREPSLAYDGVGGEVGRAVLELLGIGGRLVMFGWASGKEPTQVTTADLFAKGLTVSVAVGAKVSRRPGGIRGLEDQALEALASGAIVPLVQTFALADAAAAHRAIETRHTMGKVVLVP